MRSRTLLGILGATALPLAIGAPAAAAVPITTSTASTSVSSAPPTCFGKPATIVSRTNVQNARVYGTAGPDVIVVFGSASVRSYGGDDRVCGSSAVIAGAGNDRVSFNRSGVVVGDDEFAEFSLGDGHDFLTMAAPAPAHIYGGPGNDRIQTATGWQWVSGGSGDDTISSGKYTDHIEGGSGDDRLYGQDGTDDLYGNRGNDLLVGGNGRDYLIERAGEGRDVGRGGDGVDQCWTAVERRDSCRVDPDTEW